MKHCLAMLLALAMIAAGGAFAQSFTLITVEGENYLNNLDTCIASIDEFTLDPQETFSFNETVGERSEESGYCSATNGRGVEVVGGGVAQVATTLYLAVKHMNDLEVVEKNTYGSDFCEGYVSSGEDALLADYSQDVDFRFVNHGGKKTIEIWRDENKIYCSISESEE